MTTGTCDRCDPTADGDHPVAFLAASLDGGRFMARRHWLIAHPEYQ